MLKHRGGVAALVTLLAPLPPAAAAVPRLLSVHGTLFDVGDVPVDAALPMTVRIYDTPSGGVALWSEEHASVTIVAGFFEILVGSVDSLGNPLEPSLLASTERYLGVQVDTDVELQPRLPLVSVPYALLADRADA